jgi:RimJ/RimL family protein N-acetyltransferase
MAQMKGLKCTVRALNTAGSDIAGLIAVSNGAAIFGESAYDPARIWGWMKVKPSATSSSSSSSGGVGDDGGGGGSSNGKSKGKGKGGQAYWPCASKEVFGSYFAQQPDNQHLVVVDNRLQQPVGMLSLVDNRVSDLSIRIDNVWITPAYQTKQYAHEAMYLLLKSLFLANYRRVTVEVDSRHIIMRKFLERCGFILEAVLRKCRIVDRRNSDVALYVMLNSEWVDVDIRLKKLLGLPLQPVMHKVAEIDKAREAVPGLSRVAVDGIASNGSGSSGVSKKKKNHKKK